MMSRAPFEARSGRNFAPNKKIKKVRNKKVKQVIILTDPLQSGP